LRIGDFLNKLTHVKSSGSNQWISDCPCPTHKTPAKHLAISVEEGKILVKCFGSDTTEDIVGALGLELKDLFVDDKPMVTVTQPVKSKIVATYPYKDEDGNVLYEVVRLDPKSFRQRHQNGGGEWVWNLDGVRRVLYHLDDILIASTPIYITEGEKDAESLWAWGYVATTSPGGAGNWQDIYVDSLKGKDVVIVPDRDVPGYRYARQVAASLQDKAKSISVVLVPAKDVSEWLEAGGDMGNIPNMRQDVSCLAERVDYKRFGQLVTWSTETYQFKAEKVKEERTGVHAKLTIGQKGETLAWSYLNIERGEDRTRLANQAKKSDNELKDALDRFCEGLWNFYLDTDTPELLSGDEVVKDLDFYLRPFIAKETGVILFAPPGRGKSFSALLWAISIDAGLCKLWTVEKTTVLYINLERSKSSMSRRLSMVNTSLGLVATRPLLMLNARGKSLSDVYAASAKAINDYGIKVIILDSISRAGMGDLTENNPVNKIIDSLSSLCPTWLALAHTPRGDESHIFGGIHFDAGADVVIQLKSQEKDGKLGVAYQVTKSNDIPKPPLDIFALSFDGIKLIGVDKAKLADFPDIMANSKLDMEDAIVEQISNSDCAQMTATELSEELGFDRANISRLLNSSEKFVRLPKTGKTQFYGLRQS